MIPQILFFIYILINVSIQDGYSPCDLCKEDIEILSINYPGQPNGQYFQFLKSEVDQILKRTDWNGEVFKMEDLNTKYIGQVILYDNVNGTIGANGSGTFDITNPIGQIVFFIQGTFLRFYDYQVCLTCLGDTSVGSFRNPAPDCMCQNNYSEVIGYVCEQQCPNQCETCTIGATDECITCQNDQFLLPHCIYPKNGYFTTLALNGDTIYNKCEPRCLTCDTTPDNCTECNGLHRSISFNCVCQEGYHDDYKKKIDCVECNSTCNSCESFNICHSCVENLNRHLDPINGLCVCDRGFVDLNDGTNICQKCFMLSDQCVTECPQNTEKDDEKQICITLTYNLSPNRVLIYMLAGVIILLQLSLCLGSRYKLGLKFLAFKKQYFQNQAILESRKKNNNKIVALDAMNSTYRTGVSSSEGKRPLLKDKKLSAEDIRKLRKSRIQQTVIKLSQNDLLKQTMQSIEDEKFNSPQINSQLNTIISSPKSIGSTKNIFSGNNSIIANNKAHQKSRARTQFKLTKSNFANDNQQQDDENKIVGVNFEELKAKEQEQPHRIE